IAIEEYGHWGAAANKLRRKITNEHKSSTLYPNPLFALDVRRDIAVALARYNAHIERSSINMLPHEYSTEPAWHPAPLPPPPSTGWRPHSPPPPSTASDRAAAP